MALDINMGCDSNGAVERKGSIVLRGRLNAA